MGSDNGRGSPAVAPRLLEDLTRMELQRRRQWQIDPATQLRVLQRIMEDIRRLGSPFEAIFKRTP
jgi:hypothetical protein